MEAKKHQIKKTRKNRQQVMKIMKVAHLFSSAHSRDKTLENITIDEAVDYLIDDINACDPSSKKGAGAK